MKEALTLFFNMTRLHRQKTPIICCAGRPGREASGDPPRVFGRQRSSLSPEILGSFEVHWPQLDGGRNTGY